MSVACENTCSGRLGQDHGGLEDLNCNNADDVQVYSVSKQEVFQ